VVRLKLLPLPSSGVLLGAAAIERRTGRASVFGSVLRVQSHLVDRLFEQIVLSFSGPAGA